LDYAVGIFDAKSTNNLPVKKQCLADNVDVIGYDGQIIYQQPLNLHKTSGRDEESPVLDERAEDGYACGRFIVGSGARTALTNVSTVTQ
jgi:anhydro-N-acetylmuramic acid kinase